MAACITPTPAPQRGDEADLFRRHARHLERTVACHVNTSEAVVQDACSFAWMQLVRRQPRRACVLAWLRAVAVREAVRLDQIARRDLPLLNDTRSDEPLERAAELRDALETLAALHPRQARMIALQAMGPRYQDISAMTGDSGRTVDRQLRRARERLRQLRTAA